MNASAIALSIPIFPINTEYNPEFFCLYFRTFKQDCGFSVYLAAAKDGQYLEVRSINLEHNHPIQPELFKHLPQQRRLDPHLQAKARGLLELRAQKVLVREELERDSGNAVLMKDLSNIAAKGKALKTRNNLPEVVRVLQEKHKATVRLLTDENEDLQAIYFQDEGMKKSFQDCPEILFIDATYKLLETRWRVF
ncbi:hypothetical protein HPB48_009722 [Haemaphysalis longicornis]|uniref:ZSWIM1/3 RNaseH-like domain-containing protein n=1 Tax=Haemaphysalis longicornis TaxID=44386 RepID=A0A9J6GBK4_HAELO|nr:hypothetical protein HPB48_009722 [Haemaphysalis longicornis]